jgi:hypothetical protein
MTKKLAEFKRDDKVLVGEAFLLLHNKTRIKPDMNERLGQNHKKLRHKNGES